MELVPFGAETTCRAASPEHRRANLTRRATHASGARETAMASAPVGREAVGSSSSDGRAQVRGSACVIAENPHAFYSPDAARARMSSAAWLLARVRGHRPQGGG